MYDLSEQCHAKSNDIIPSLATTGAAVKNKATLTLRRLLPDGILSNSLLMARPQNQKQRHTEKSSQNTPCPSNRVENAGERNGLLERKRKFSESPSQSSQPSKKPQPANASARDSPSAKTVKSKANYPPGFWDMFLGPPQNNFPPDFWDGLSKVWLTRRALRELDRRNQEKPAGTKTLATLVVRPKSLSRFARRGGPDISHMRGYPQPNDAVQMDSKRSRSPRLKRSKATTGSPKSRRSSAYDKAFEQNLVDHDIYPEWCREPNGGPLPEPNNMEDIIENLSAPRGSLSPSQFPDSVFEKFQEANLQVISEDRAMREILPVMCGEADIPNESKLCFDNISEMTNRTTVNLKPGFFDGSYPQAVNKVVQDNLNSVIHPTGFSGAPVAPNFFLEARPPSGGVDVAKRQACMDGAYGARAMHALQTYGATALTYDGIAYSYSSTYHDGHLKLHAYYLKAPLTPGGRPRYHMTQIRGWAMTSDANTFRRGAAAFRNARDLAQKHRNTFIQAANSRALELEVVVEDTNQNPGSSGSDDRPGSTWQDHDDALQQHIAESSGLQSLDPDDHQSQNLDQTATGLEVEEPSSSNKALWVVTYYHEGRICFRNRAGEEVRTVSNDWTEQMGFGPQFFCWTGAGSDGTIWATTLATAAEEGGQ